MTDQEWRIGTPQLDIQRAILKGERLTDEEWRWAIEQALTAAWRQGADMPEGLRKRQQRAWTAWYEQRRNAIKDVARELADVLPLHIAMIYTRVDEIGRFRVGPARDEAA